MIKLTDAQSLILSKASQRDDRAVELPIDLKGAAAEKVLDGLLSAASSKRSWAKRKTLIWREIKGDGRPLVITVAGLGAIGVDEGREESPARPAAHGAKGKPAPLGIRRPERAAGSRRPSRRQAAGRVTDAIRFKAGPCCLALGPQTWRNARRRGVSDHDRGPRF